MADVIPEYIGSRLSAIDQMADNSITEMSTPDVQGDEKLPVISIFNNVPKTQKDRTMIKKTVKRKKGKEKKLPLNPNAKSSVISEGLESTVAQKNENEAGSGEVVINDDVTPKENLLAGLKSIPSKKKKVVRPSTKKTKISKPASSVKEESVSEVPMTEVKNPPSTNESNDQLAAIEEKVQAQSKNTVQVEPARKADKKEVKNAISDAEKRRQYIENLRKETHSYLDQLAAERKQRQVEYQAFRKKMRDQLAGK
ncbi:MAG: hypothetical protein AAF789_08225 [Bacteroidota bacterium]